MADLETLTLQINTESSKATEAIDALAQRLNNLSVSIAKLETGKLNDLASGLNNLNAVIYNMNATSSKWDYKRIVGNITSLSAIDTAKLNELSSAIAYLGNSLNGFASTVAISDNVRSLVNAVGRLGGKSVTAAITNIPLLENALAHLITSFSTLPSINQSVIDFTNSLANLASQGQRIGSATNTINNSLDRFSSAATRASRKSFNLASAIGKVYAQFWILMRAVSGLKKSFMDTADYLEAYNYFDVVAGKIGADTFAKAGVGSADDYAEAFTSEMRRKLKQMSGLELDLEDRLIKTTNAKSLGLNITEITQYQASIASITNAMGQAQEVSTATAKAFSMLAADMGSLRNVDYEQVAANLQSALTGQARALYKYGIDLTAATLEQYAYANGVDKAVSEMTQAEKAQLRLLAILDQSKVAWGDLANTINSPANQMRQLKTNLEELGTVFGQLFIPVLQRTLPWVNGLSIALKQLLIDIASLLGIELNLDEFGQGFSDTIDEDTEAIDELNKSMKETKKGIREFDELKVIGGDKSKAGSGLSDQIDLTQQILKATDEYERVWDEAYRKMESKAQAVAEALKGALDPIRKIVEDFHLGNFFEAGEDVSDLAISIFDFVSNAIDSVDWTTIGNKIGEFISGIKWDEVFSGFGDLIWSAIQGAIKLWNGAFDVAPFETALLTAFGILHFTSLGQTLTANITSSISGWFKNHGVDSKFLAKAGIGAIAVGLSVAFTIDNVTDVQTGKYAATSLNSLAKIGISSLLAGAGFTLIASALGVAGLTGLGIAFVVGVGLSAVFNIISAKLSEPKPNVERDIAKQQYAWVEQKHLDNIDVVTNITMKAGDLDDQMGNIDFLASKVEDLSERYDELTESERGQLKYYSDELVKIMPEIANQIDSVTGAYTGQKEELEKLIATQKAQIQQSALLSITSDIEKRKYELQPEYERLKNESRINREKFNIATRTAQEAGITNAQLLDMMEGREVEGVSAETAKKYKQIYENMVASDEAYQLIATDWNTLQQQYSYYMGEYEKAVSVTLENTTQDVEDASEDVKEIIKRPTLPNAMSNTLSRIDTVIKRDGAVSEYDMNSLFENIDKSFSGLGDGQVPSEVQTMMDNIKLAILSNSPELTDYMVQLKQLMIDAFVNAGAYYTSGGQVLYNRNGIAERLYQDVGKIEEGTYKKTDVRNNVKNMKADLLELFGGKELPEEVNKAYTELADTINSGKGQAEVFKAIENFKTKVGTVAYQTGIKFDFGLGTGVWDGSNYFFTSLKDMYNGGFEVTEEVNDMHSPSRKYEKLAENIPLGAALGIEKGIPTLELAVKSMSNAIQSTWGNVEYNVPSLGLGYRNSQNGFNYGSMDSSNGFMAQMLNVANMGAQNGQTEVVFRVEGDPYGIFKVVREENDKYRNRTHRSAFN